jgi:DNA-binding MarR family transcriptional regulator
MDDATRIGALSDEMIRLTRASHAMRTQMAARGLEGGVEMAAYGLLFQLVAGGPKRSSALAESACVDPSTVSRQVGQLVTAGLVERQPDPEDGRATLLAATPAGQELYETKMRRRVQLFSRLVEDWSDADVETLTGLLNRFNDNFATLRPALLDDMSGAHPRTEESA